MEVDDLFNYLGIVFTSGGSFMQTASTLAGKALRSMSSLMSLIKCNQAPIDISFNLFDSYVLLIFNYNSEFGFL